MAFADDAFDLARNTDLDGFEIDLATGVASGPVTVGLTGTTRLVYDVWGTTVRRADQLARRAEPGMLLASDETAEKLPESVSMSEYAQVTGQMAWRIGRQRSEERS